MYKGEPPPQVVPPKLVLSTIWILPGLAEDETQCLAQTQTAGKSCAVIQEQETRMMSPAGLCCATEQVSAVVTQVGAKQRHASLT